MSFRLPVFTRRAKRVTARHLKFFLFDTGVFRSLRPKGPLDKPEEIEGAALEGLVVQHLRAWNAYRRENNELYYWRTRSGLEVDVVLYGEDGFWAIEIKNSGKVHPQDTKSLRAFKEDYPESEAILLYRGKERLRLGPVRCLPCEEFLRNSIPRKVGSMRPSDGCSSRHGASIVTVTVPVLIVTLLGQDYMYHSNMIVASSQRAS